MNMEFRGYLLAMDSFSYQGKCERLLDQLHKFPERVFCLLDDCIACYWVEDRLIKVSC